MMVNEMNRKMIGMLVVVLVLIVGVSAQYSPSSGFGSGYSSTFTGGYRTYGSSINPQFTEPGFSSGSSYTSPGIYWPKFDQDDCYARQDFIMQIVPGGCSPPVVRSDLLEEQNVPVFCKVMTIQANPLMDVSRVRSIRFKGEYPRGVSGVSYFPERATLRGSPLRQKSLVSSPVNDNLGYLVVVLSRQEVEGEMPEFVEGNITALVEYDTEGAFGVGENNFYVHQMDDVEWARDYREYGFWNGKGYIRAESIGSDSATISIYKDVDSRGSSVTLRKGETSKDIYLPGYYCSAGMKIKLESLDAPVESALLQINDQQVWVSKGDKIIDGKCRILDLDVYGTGGKVSVSCPVKNGKFDLSLISGKAEFSIDGKFKEYGIGAKIDYEKDIYLGYLGQDKDNERFAVLVSDNFSYSESDFADMKIYEVVESFAKGKSVGDMGAEIEKVIKNQYKAKLKADQKLVDANVKVEVVKEGESGFGISLDDVLVAKDKDWSAEDLSEQDVLALEYYDKSIEKYEDLVDFFPDEKMQFVGEDSYAAKGLYKAAKLSSKFGMNEKAQEFYSQLLRDYPHSNIANFAVREKELGMKYDTSNARAVVNINNQQYFIDLLDLKKPKQSDLGVVLMIDGEERTFGLNEIKILKREGAKTSSIEVVKVEDDYIEIKYKNLEDKEEVRKLDLGENRGAFFDGVNVRLTAINLNKQAKLVIVPKAFGPRGESNFKFKIGIEKRAIQLSPEQTMNMMDSLEESMKMWNEVNAKLGKVVKAMKGACFATSALLTAKNFFDGLSGESVSRNEIMTNVGGWNEACEKLVNEKKYLSVQQCLLDKRKEIDSDVKVYADEIEKTNKIIEEIQDKIGIERNGIFDFDGQVDSKAVDEEFKNVFDDFCAGAEGNIELPDGDKTLVSFGGDNGICKWDSLTHEQRREIMTLYNSRNSGSSVLKNMADKELGRTVLDAKNHEEVNDAINEADKNRDKHDLDVDIITPVGDMITHGDVKVITKGDSGHDIYGNLDVGKSVVRILVPHKKSFGNGIFTAHLEVAGKEVIVQVEGIENSGGVYVPRGKIYHLNGGEVGEDGANSVREYMSLAGVNKIKDVGRNAYQNSIKDPGKLFVKYFERAPYKGLPAEVVFDTVNGWYAEMTYVLSGFGKPYDESGRVVNFYICNVGENGLIEFKHSADDICRYYNGNVNTGLNFPGMSLKDSTLLVQKARQAITDAAKQYGKESVSINGRVFKSGISFGGEEGRCTDFMSPGDCNLMFNVCDPVMCPASRCDLGGRYRVDNVMQTGVVGSLLLCLPNFREGIVMPICLTGVHAGIEGYVSILNSTRACLNESLETGRNVGVCDEIKSIYLCEFFWKQAAPLLEILVPNIFGNLYGQGVRGGGEYLTVQRAWDNVQGAINYFRNEYATNSMIAFHARSTEDVGGTFCKSFISLNVPDMENFFDVLTEPDSPVQYHAWFSEDVLTSATIPPMSHYKVYYHIYAGKDYGAYYTVYLKDLPEMNYVRSSGHYVVDRGYVPRGGQVDQARDFTVTSGYKQLCVSVNGKDECGFGKVSTSYLLNSLTDRYAEEQIKTGIVSENECIAGTPSLLTAIQPNLQAGVESVITPELYNHGIIRVCATENPGKQITPDGEYDRAGSTYDKWKEVGYCDDPTIKCWLDTDSVKDVIKDKGLEEQVLDEVDLNILGEIDYLSEGVSRAIGSEAEEFIRYLVIKNDDEEIIEGEIKGVVGKLDRLVNLGAHNVHRARGLYLLGRLYKKIAENLLSDNVEVLVDEISFDTLGDGGVGGGGVSGGEGGDGTGEVGGEVLVDEVSFDTQEVEDERIEWTDDMLKESVKIKIIYSDFGNEDTIIYLYDSGRGWVSEDREFVEMKMKYVEGVRYLVGKTDFVRDRIIIEGNVIDNGILDTDEDLSDEIFVVLRE